MRWYLAGVDPQRIIEDLSEQLRRTAEQVVPWFVTQMPEAYVRDTPEETRLSHVGAIVAARASGVATRLKLEHDDGRLWTFIDEKNYPGLLADLVRQLPHDRTLRSAKVHTAADGSLVLDVFRFGAPPEPFDETDPVQSKMRDEAIAYAKAQGDEDSAEELRELFEASSAEFVRTVTPLRVYHYWQMWRGVAGTDDTTVTLRDQAEPGYRRISVASGNAETRTFFERAVTHLGRQGFDIRRAFVDVFDGKRGSVTVLGFIVDDADGRLAREAEQVSHDLIRLRWIDDVALALAYRHDLALTRAEIAVALMHLAHAALAVSDRFAFARERLYETLERRLPLALAIADGFAAREDLSSIAERIEAEVPGERDRRALVAMLESARSTIATNVDRRDRYGLAIRFDPQLLAGDGRPQLPYGAFFVHGGDFDGFHVRFRDVARGGVRLVRPRGPEEHGFALERLYDEAYGLAHAQQLKNKDIPEGGSKAVVLVEPGRPTGPSLKAFADGLLDVILETGERLYLGPDENVTDDLIEWVVARAAARGYATPNAFMSSKPGAGINHKTYGVTSEGVTVFLEEALRSVGIDPRAQAFSVKLTGGPDGDVAGNEIKILHREYGENAKIVGIADGSGSARDPDGLDHAELLRLVERSEPISSFDRSRLGPRGIAASLEEPDGLRLRNTMGFEVVADAFVPAGGRPQTIHEKNWRDYLNDKGEPSSRVIVEGANLYITPDARRLLSEEAGVRIVKDSSANKCGVICSSYEIAASMLLDPEDFMKVKERFVAEVLVRLRELARKEARLLFAEHARQSNTVLPELSVQLSQTILAATDAIEAAVEQADEPTKKSLSALVRDHLPPVLIELAGDRIDERLPDRYRTGIIGAVLSTRIVYREGLTYLRGLEPAALADLAMRYLTEEAQTRRLVETVRGSTLPDRERIAALLEHGGTRSAIALDGSE